MILKDIISNSYYASVGYIETMDDIIRLDQYITYNLDILKQFKGIIHCNTYKENNNLHEYVDHVWKTYFPECFGINNGISRGHSFGACDNDDAIFNYCKNNQIEWMCKSANDMVFEKEILDINVEFADFYYLNGMGYSELEKYSFDIEKTINSTFYPQTNFYILNVGKCDYLNDRQHVDEIYNKIIKLPDYSGKAWHYGFRSCETLLAECIERNSLKKFHLMSYNVFKLLTQYVFYSEIRDSSHKNIMIEGICHFHLPNEPIAKI